MKFLRKNIHNIFWLVYSILILLYVNFEFSCREFNILDLGFIMIICLLYMIHYILVNLEYIIEFNKNLLDEKF